MTFADPEMLGSYVQFMTDPEVMSGMMKMMDPALMAQMMTAMFQMTMSMGGALGGN